MATPTGDLERGARIRSARRRAGLTQRQLLERLPSAPPERDDTWISNIETGYRNPSVQDLAEICAALGVTTDSIVFGKTAPVPTEDEALLVYAWRKAAPIARRLLMASARAIAEDPAPYDPTPPRRRAARPAPPPPPPDEDEQADGRTEASA